MPSMLRPMKAQKIVDQMTRSKGYQERPKGADQTFTKVSDTRPNPRTAGYVR
jgi:hypothetical protein